MQKDSSRSFGNVQATLPAGRGAGRSCSQSLVPGDALPGRAVMPRTVPAAPRQGCPR